MKHEVIIDICKCVGCGLSKFRQNTPTSIGGAMNACYTLFLLDK